MSILLVTASGMLHAVRTVDLGNVKKCAGQLPRKSEPATSEKKKLIFMYCFVCLEAILQILLLLLLLFLLS